MDDYNQLNLVNLLKSSKIIKQLYDYIILTIKPYVYIYLIINILIKYLMSLVKIVIMIYI